METFIATCVLLAILFFELNANGLLPFSRKYSGSSRALLYSMVCLCLVPVVVFLCHYDSESFTVMMIALCGDFLIYSFLADERMYEELVPGYKEGKERKKEFRRALRQQRKRKPEAETQ